VSSTAPALLCDLGQAAHRSCPSADWLQELTPQQQALVAPRLTGTQGTQGDSGGADSVWLTKGLTEGWTPQEHIERWFWDLNG